MTIFDSQTPYPRDRDPEDRRSCGSTREPFGTTIQWARLLVLAAVTLAFLPARAGSQALPYAGDTPDTAPVATASQLDLTYVRPTQRTKINNYLFDAYGPYPIGGAMFAAGINQLTNAPPEWHQGFEGYGKRFGSDFAIAAVGTTTRYGLAEAFKEDTLYYRCECKGIMPRLGHAMISTLTARRGEDGHRVFSLPAFLAPYAASMTAVYGWFPNRYSAKDAFRIGNYGLLAYMGETMALEFSFSGPHSLLTRMHLGNTRASAPPVPNPGSNP